MTSNPREGRGERGLTMIELCVVILVLGILLVTGAAMLMRARMMSNEGAAIASLRATSSAQFAYQSGCGAGLYATSYLVLGRGPVPGAAGYISEDLGSTATPQRSGYTFTIAVGRGGALSTPDCNGNPTQTNYYATAVPEVPGETGTRSFAVTERGSIYESANEVPPAEPFEPPAKLID